MCLVDADEGSSLGAADVIDDLDESVDNQCVQAQLRGRLEGVLEALSESDRAMIHTIYYEGISMRRYAKWIGRDERTIRRRHAKLLRRLAVELEAGQGD